MAGSDIEIQCEIRDLVTTIKGLLKDFAANEGEITACAYDTAWVARIPALDGSQNPQFPESVDWVLRSQLPDGSWGDEFVDVASDRILATTTAIVALKTWKIGQIEIQKGVEYLRNNINRLQGTKGVLIPVGYELILPAVLDDAQELGLDLPYESEVVQTLKEMGRKKRARIPLEMLYARPTTLMFSLEGLKGQPIDWQRVLKLQIRDGSMMCSPAATAFALISTGDPKCLGYLEKLVRKFDGAVPNFYPLDMFQILWTVDGLQRLGIARYFQEEISESIAFAYSVWTDLKGVGWSKNLPGLEDIDCTSVAFRLFRMHGYDIPEGVYKKYRKDGEFVCYEGQLIQGVSDMFALYRATELIFPEEEIIDEAAKFSRRFLENALAQNLTNADKWSIKEDLYGELKRRLSNPLHFVLPRLEINDYIGRYGVEDPWVAKAVYRLPLVNNKNYLALAKADNRLCQSHYVKELLEISEWMRASQLDSWTSLYETSMKSYFVFAAELWEPEYSTLRTVATKSTILTMHLRNLIDENQNRRGHCRALLEAVKRWNPELVSTVPQNFKTLFMALWKTVNKFTEEASRLQGRDVSKYITSTWERLATTMEIETEWKRSATVPSLEDYTSNGLVSLGAEPPILTSLLLTGTVLEDPVLAQIDHRSDFWANSCLYARLAIDLGLSKEKEYAIPACYTQEYSSLSEAEVHDLLLSQKQNLVKQLNRSRWGPSSAAFSTICKRLVSSISRVVPRISDIGRNSDPSPHLTGDEQELLFQLHVDQDLKSIVRRQYSAAPQTV